jgi:hypothetical protein
MAGRTRVTSSFCYQGFLGRMKARYNSQHLQFVRRFGEAGTIDTVDNCASCCFHITKTLFSHITDDLQLGRRCLLQDSRTETQLKISGVITSLNKGVWTKFFSIPLMDESFETKIAEHGHVTSVKYSLQKCKDLFFTLRKSLAGVSSTAFPINHNTVCIY